MKIWAITLILLSVALAGCKPRVSQRSKLWSETAGNDFARLVKQGRSVAEHSPDSKGVLALDSNTGGTIAGYQAIEIEVDVSSGSVAAASFDTTKTPPIATSQLAIEAQRILMAGAKTLGLQPTEIQHMTDADLVRANWATIHFRRIVSGLTVRDARIDVVFAQKGATWRLAEIKNRGWGQTSELGDTQKVSLTAEQLTSVTGLSNLKIDKTGAELVPVKSENGDTKLYRANWYQVSGNDDLTYTLTFSGESSPKLLEAFRHRYDQAIKGESYVRSYSDGVKALYPLADASYIGSSGTEFLNENGEVSNPSSTGKIQLNGRYAQVKAQNSQTYTSLNVVQTAGQWSIELPGMALSDVNVYTGLTRIRQFAKRFLTESETGYFNKRLRVTTQVTGECNAYYQGLKLVFFHKSGGCADMATMNDVIMHEWGHGLDDYTGPGQKNGGGISDGAFSEGLSDVVGFLYTGDSALAKGFFTDNPDKPIRNADNDLRYTGVKLQVHKEGTIISGAFWELRRRMINKYGADTGVTKAASLFYKHLAEADNYLASYKIVQRLADDDGNPATKSADFCLINHAFAKKGLTPKDPCTDGYDTFSGNQTPPSNDMFLAIAGESAAGLMFEGSSRNASVQTMGLCKSATCTTPELTLSFKTTTGDRRIYGSSGSLLLNGGETLRMLGLDSGGSIISSRIIRLKKN